MDLGRSFAFPFRDPAWVPRLGVGALLELIPLLLALPLALGAFETREGTPRLLVMLLFPAVLGLASRWVQLGYLRRLAQAVLEDPAARLPRWDRFEQDLTEGLKLWLVTVALFLPALGVAAILVFLTLVAGVPALFWLPLLLVAAPLVVAITVYLPAALLTAIARRDLAAAFDVGSVWAVVARDGGLYLLGFVVAIAAEVLAQFGVLACCIGIFFTRFAAHCVTVHAFCCAYRGLTAAGPVPGGSGAGGPFGGQ